MVQSVNDDRSLPIPDLFGVEQRLLLKHCRPDTDIG